MVMPNSIELIKKYAAENLDRIFVMESVTGILENRQGIELKPVENDAKTVLIPDIVMDGLGDYDMDNGFPKGSVTLKFTPYQCEKDRGREFNLDSVLNAESAGITASNLMVEFERTQVIPEVDAYRLSKLFANADAGSIVSKNIAENAVIKEFNAIIKYYTDLEIPTSRVVMFISSDIDMLIKNSTELQKKVSQVDYKVGEITFKVRMYEEIPLIVVPAKRFKTAYDFTANGFTPSAGALDISVLTTHTNAALPYKKHEKVRVFDPDTNQEMDAWKFQYRLYHDIITPTNKKKGIYVITKPAA